MGKYLDLINNIDVRGFNITEQFNKTDLVSPAIQESVRFTNGWLGLGIATTLLFIFYSHLSNKENLFELSKSQAMISAVILVFTIVLYMVQFGLFTSSQHFIWLAVISFVSIVSGTLKTN